MAGYTITETKSNNGYAVFDHKYYGDRDGTLVAVAKTKQELAEFFGDVDTQRVWPTPEKVSKDLVDCFPSVLSLTRKISMIKLVRTTTNCGLKEAKEAVEHAIHAAYPLSQGY
jgi:hypothetical protein